MNTILAIFSGIGLSLVFYLGQKLSEKIENDNWTWLEPWCIFWKYAIWVYVLIFIFLVKK